MIQEFDGHVPKLDETAWVHEGAWVIGEVRLGAEVNVWPTAVLRGDMGPIEIGAHTNLQDGAICHDTGGRSVTRIGERVTVGHRAILHGCQVEDDCLIGMGAIVMDNARIRRGSIVAAGALVLAGREFPEGQMIMGSPAKAVRPLTDEERQWVEYSWRVYADRARWWREKQ